MMREVHLVWLCSFSVILTVVNANSLWDLNFPGRTNPSLGISWDLDTPTAQSIMDERLNEYHMDLTKILLGHRIRRSTHADVLLPESFSNYNMTQLPNVQVNNLKSKALCSFKYHDQWYLTVTTNILRYTSEGLVEHVLSGFPVGQDQDVECSVYENFIFYAIGNATSLQLYLLSSPYATTLILVQKIKTSKFYDRYFFVDDGQFYMLLGLNSVLTGISKIQVMGWMGTMMDSMITLEAPNLGSFCYLTDETYTYIIAVDKKSGFVSVWRLLLGIRAHDLVERVELTNVIQVLAFQVFHENYFLCSQGSITRIYWLNGQHATLWQIIEHQSIPDNAWLVSYDFGLPTLVLKLWDKLKFYQPDYQGHMKPVFTTDHLWDGEIYNLKLMPMPSKKSMYLAANALSSTNGISFTTGEFGLRSSVVDLDPVDPLLECLNKLEVEVKEEQVLFGVLEGLGASMLHEGDDVRIDNLVVLTVGSQNATFNSIYVLPNSSYSINSSDNLEAEHDKLFDLATTLLLQASEIVYNNTPAVIEGSITSSHKDLYVEEAKFSQLQSDKLNDIDFGYWIESFWRYRLPQLIEQDVFVDKFYSNKTILMGKIGDRFETTEILLKSGNQTVRGHWDVQGLDLSGSIVVDYINDVNISDILTKNPSNSYYVEGNKGFSSLQIPVVDLPEGGLTNGVDLSLWSDSVLYPDALEPQNVTGKVVFNGHTEFKDNLNLNWFNDIFTMPEFYTSVALRSDPFIEIIGDIAFVEHVNTGELWVTHNLNGVDPQKLVLTSGGQTVISNITLNDIHVFGNLESNNINGMDVGSEAFGFDGDVLVDNQAIFKNVEIGNLELESEKSLLGSLNLTKLLQKRSFYIMYDVNVTNMLTTMDLRVAVINDVNVTNLEKKYWLKSVEQNVPISLSFVNASFGTVDNTLLNGFSLEQDYYYTNRDETVLGDVVFKDNLVSLSSTTFDSTVDDVSINELLADMVRLNGASNITGVKTFDTLEINGRLFTFYVNNHDIGEDFVYLDRENVLSDRMQFHAGSIMGDVHIQGHVNAELVNYVDLQVLQSETVFKDEMDALTSNLVFLNDLNVESIVIGGALNHHNLSYIWQDGLRINSPNVVRLNQTVMSGAVSLDGITAFNYLNTKPLDFYLQKAVRRDDPDLHITGAKSIDSLIVGKNATFAVYNDVDLNAAVSGILTLSEDQEITAKYTFGNLTAMNIENVSEVGGIAWSNLVFSHEGDVIIESDMILDDPLYAEHLLILDEKVNGCYLNQSRVMWLPITEFDYLDNLTINGQLLLQYPELNQPNLTHLLNHGVMTNLPNIITGKVSFQSSVAADKVQVLNSRDLNVDLGDILNNSLLLSGTNQVVKGPIMYDSVRTNVRTMTADNLLLQIWNGLDLINFLPSLVSVDGNSVITGTKTFWAPVDIRFNMEAAQLISGGVDFLRVVRASDPQWPAGTTFHRIMIESAMSVTNIGGMNLDKFLDNRVVLDGPQIVNSNLRLIGMTLENATAEQINDILVDDLVLQRSSPNQVITGSKIISRSLVLEGDVEVQRMNMVPVQEFVDTLVPPGVNTTFSAPQEFLGGIHVSRQTNISIYNDQHLPSILELVSDTVIQAKSEVVVLKEVENSLLNSSKPLAKSSLGLPVVFEHFDLTKTLYMPQNMISLSASSGSGRAWIATSSSKCDYEILTTSDGVNFKTVSKIEPPWPNLLAKRVFLFDPFQDGSVFLVGVGNTDQCPEGEGSVWITRLDSEGNLLTKETLSPLLRVSDVSMTYSPSIGIWMTILTHDDSGASLVHIYQCTESGNWYTREVLALGPVTAIDMAVVKDDIHVALASANESLSHVTSYIYVINKHSEVSQWQTFDLVGANVVKFLTTPSEVYLVLGQKAPQQIFKSYPSLLFRYQGSAYVEFQKMAYEHLDDVVFMRIHGITYGALLSNSQLAIHRCEEGRGLRQLHTFTIGGATSLASFGWSGHSNMLVRTPSSLQVLHSVSRGISRERILN